jgi:protein involved in polysaccharide export with SLBB domain
MALASAGLENVKVDELSDEQVQEIINKAQANGYTVEQLESLALAKGMPTAEIQKLKARIQNLQGKIKNIGSKEIERKRTEIKEIMPIASEDIFSSVKPKPATSDTIPQKLKRIFGFSLFTTPSLTFEPSLNIPTPKDYQLGPGDEIIIDIWGASQNNYKLTISPDGYIFIDNVGPIFINGLNIDDASRRIISKLGTIYSGLKGPQPNTFALVTLGNVRSIKVTIIGEVNQPGTYTVSSLSTVFNALYLSGGPNVNGSIRNIEILRNNKVYSTLDIYDFLLKGDQSGNIRLQDQDIIRINPYNTRIELTGEVKRPAIYEIKDTLKETLDKIILYAGGFTDKAYRERIKIYRKSIKEKEISDIDYKNFPVFRLKDGDSIPVEPILGRFLNKVRIEGAVYRPGDYELTEKLTLKELILKADGLKGDAFQSRASIYRTKEDLSIEVIPINITNIFAGKEPDIPLIKDDLVVINSIFDLHEEYYIEIAGEVQKPGKYTFIENSTLEDIILLAGGLLESASLSKIEIARRIKSETLPKDGKTSEIFQFQVNKDFTLPDSAQKFVLQPFDIISIKRSPGYETQRLVYIEGEVLYPGAYTISNRNERISDLLKRAGGFTPEAYIKGARFSRIMSQYDKQRLSIISNVLNSSNDSIKLNILDTSETNIGIELEKIIRNPGCRYDLLLQEGDRLTIPKQLQTVRVNGAVLYPGSIIYDNSYGFRKYITQAGGFNQNAKRNRSFIIYPNGKVDRTKRFLGFYVFPKVEPGSEIIVPSEPPKEKRRITTAELAALTSALSSLAYITIIMYNYFKK